MRYRSRRKHLSPLKPKQTSHQISINASCSLDEIMSAREEGQKVFFQVRP